MEASYEHVIAHAATIDELLSDAHRSLPGQKGDADRAARRLAAWCRASAGGDWALFARRLRRDGMAIDDVLARFATVRRDPRVPDAGWMRDAAWVGAAVHRSADAPRADPPVAFEQLLLPVVTEAERRLWDGLDADDVADSARSDMRRALLTNLSDLAAPAIYERFTEQGASYDDFVADMKAAGFRELFEDKPVLLRLMATVARQWIDASREVLDRLTADLPSIRDTLLASQSPGRLSTVRTGLSDPHNGGRTVHVLGFQDGSQVVYKPKDLTVDGAWAALVDGLNRAAPVDLRAMRVLVRDGYGWTEFIDHTPCDGPHDFPSFFRRAGALLALFHVVVGVDMHQENIVAAGAYPVPIDLEMILQPADTRIEQGDDVGEAFRAAMRTVIDSVITIGLLPAYGKHSTSKVFAIGGVNSNSTPRMRMGWADVNTDAMRPVRVTDATSTVTNLPYVGGRRAGLGEHLDDLMAGFADYARFLRTQEPRILVDAFAGSSIRTVIRPTRYYTMLLARLRDHRTMDDGAVWSAQADFTARLADWEADDDPLWPLQHRERTAVVDLNVPHFTTAATPGLLRAQNRLRGLDDAEIDWQLEVIRQNTDLLRRRPTAARTLPPPTCERAAEVFTAEADAIARALSERAVRRGRGAAWVGLDWLGDSEVSQLVVLGPDLYNGACGIALFLAAHAAVAGEPTSGELALAAIAGLRASIAGRTAARMARSVGVGGALGLGSIVYTLAVVSVLLDDPSVLADAHAAATLFSDDLIAADRSLDVLGGSAGAILGLLRLYRQTGSDDVLRVAERCGRHLLGRERVGPIGQRSWLSPAFGRPLNGMSHGAAGFAYSLTALACATGSDEFAQPVAECIAFEDSTFGVDHGGWADLRDTADACPPCKWCYGAPGIGLARIAMIKLAGAHMDSSRSDIERALAAVRDGWPAPTDTLCCGTLGSVEFLWEAGTVLRRDDLCERATRDLLAVVQAARRDGDYRWSSGTGRFNLGLFRGVAGVGYTLLRQVDRSLPDVLVWE